MKRTCAVLMAASMWVGMAWAQTSAPQAPPSGAEAQTGAGTARGSARGGATGGMRGMGMPDQQHMQQMQANLNRMHALLNSMRSSVTAMEPRDQPPMLSNIELWQLMLDHMDDMMKRMRQMHGADTTDRGKPAPHTH